MENKVQTLVGQAQHTLMDTLEAELTWQEEILQLLAEAKSNLDKRYAEARGTK